MLDRGALEENAELYFKSMVPTFDPSRPPLSLPMNVIMIMKLHRNFGVPPLQLFQKVDLFPGDPPQAQASRVTAPGRGTSKSIDVFATSSLYSQ